MIDQLKQALAPFALQMDPELGDDEYVHEPPFTAGQYRAAKRAYNEACEQAALWVDEVDEEVRSQWIEAIKTSSDNWITQKEDATNRMIKSVDAWVRAHDAHKDKAHER